jgi:sortase A
LKIPIKAQDVRLNASLTGGGGTALRRESGAHCRGLTEGLLFTAGLLMLGVYVGARVQGIVLSSADILRFKRQSPAASPESGWTGIVNSKTPDFSLWAETRIAQYKNSLGAHFSSAIAVLRIPKIHLETPLLEGTDDFTLNRAVGLIAGTARPGEIGNVGIAGHRDGFFRGLKDVAIGDTLELVTETKINTYVIDRIVIVEPSDVSVLGARPTPSVTLVTCYPFYYIGSAPHRYIVQASLTRSAAIGPGP